MWSTTNLTRRGDRGARFTFFFHLSRRYHELFPTRRHFWGVVDYRRNVKKNERKKWKRERKKERKKGKRIKQRNQNYGINEHDISYTKNEISLKMFIVFISFRRQFGASEVFFPWAQLAPETAWHPSRHVDLLLFFLSCPPLSFIFFCLFPLLFLFFLSFFFLFSFFVSFLFSFSVSFPFLFLSIWHPFWWPRRTRAPKAASKIRPCYLRSLYPPVSLCLLFFFVLSSRKFQPILQKVESRGRCCLYINLSSIFLWFSPNLPFNALTLLDTNYLHVLFLGTSGGGAANTEWPHIQGPPNRQRKGKNI